jgi:hypothetical protein
MCHFICYVTRRHSFDQVWPAMCNSLLKFFVVRAMTVLFELEKHLYDSICDFETACMLHS